MTSPLPHHHTYQWSDTTTSCHATNAMTACKVSCICPCVSSSCVLPFKESWSQVFHKDSMVFLICRTSKLSHAV